jgi:membrane-associated phospholipid phosphatase
LNKSAIPTISQLISVIFHPIFFPIYLIIILFGFAPDPFFFTYFTGKLKYGLFIIVLLYSSVFPLLMVYYLNRMKQISDFTLPLPKDRIKVLALISGIYIALAYFLLSKGNLLRPLAFVFCIFVIHMVGLAIITYFSKISIHVSTVFAVIGVLAMVFSRYAEYSLFYPILGLIILAGIIAGARLDLKAHSIREIAYGALYGLLSGFVSSYFLI